MKYKFIRKIGKGGYSIVYLALDNNNKNVAIKEIDLLNLTNKEKDMIIGEIKIGYFNNCKYLVKFKDFYIDNNKLYLVMDYYNNQDLYYYNKKHLTEKKKIGLFLRICLGLQYLHSNKIIHRDLKSCNIMMHNDIPYIGDFGICKILPDNEYLTNTCIGTPLYICPEIIKGEIYNFKADIYSLGCVLSEIFHKKLPYNGYDLKNLYDNVLKQRKNIYSKNTYMDKILNKLIHNNPVRRPNTDFIIKEIAYHYNLDNVNQNRKDVKFYNKVRKYYKTPDKIYKWNDILNDIRNTVN